MRLLDTKSQSLVEFQANEIPEYAILSHRWQAEEVTFKNMCDGIQQSLAGYSKIKSCCELAQKRGMPYVWIDTCCIDKSSSAELTESINSMYQWYAKASECYAYLSDVDIETLDTANDHDQFAASAWFTRGWTLQELIAPSEVVFYNSRWTKFGTKAELRSTLSKITSVDVKVLEGSSPPSSSSIAQRMSWAAQRVTTRIEDLAYCLLGIFEVNMPLLYGEGNRAFFRLQRKIIKQLDDQTIFAWTDSQQYKPVFAPSPTCFQGLQNLVRVNPTNDPREGYTLANSGLSIQVMLLPFSMNRFLAPLSCGYLDTGEGDNQKKSLRGYRRACIVLQQTQHYNHYVRVSHEGQDLFIKHADDVAFTRDHFKLKPRRVFIQQQLPNLADPLFYGFEFSFNHSGLFGDNQIPSAADVLCSNSWSGESLVFELSQEVHRAAGFFRFNGISNHKRTIFMHLGFDLDFAPVCVIRSVSRSARDSNSSRALDFRMLPKNALDDLLDLKWLLKMVEIQNTSKDTIVAFRGEHQNSAEVVCKPLSLKLLFRVQYSERLKSSVWHVSFERLQQSDLPSSDESHTDCSYTAPQQISEPTRRQPAGLTPHGRAIRLHRPLREEAFRDSILELTLVQQRVHETRRDTRIRPGPVDLEISDPQILPKSPSLNGNAESKPGLDRTEVSQESGKPSGDFAPVEPPEERLQRPDPRKINTGSYKETIRQISKIWTKN